MTLTHSWFTLVFLKLTSKNVSDVSALDDAAGVDSIEATEAERVFLRELICEQSEAVQSELGVMALMSQYPRKF